MNRIIPLPQIPDDPVNAGVGDVRVTLRQIGHVVQFHEHVLADGPCMLKTIAERAQRTMHDLKLYAKDLEEVLDWVDKYIDECCDDGGLRIVDEDEELLATSDE